ncbi:hypothetical protein N7481_012118 [Penicillium waksmanii]|uniref:uncharacterized protein n=1 Tax=Penicillium waksmanii TaxID=69791 RepID=UPI002546DDDA|nr:uncharacterized protein N7481_012118 [Penicillium waksmanii]KAJ5965404.1 hypothetical protein N7481_012118 [Penicillium waksmanii]
MEQIINVAELKQPQADTKTFSHTCLCSQSPTPVGSQTGHDYSLVHPHTRPHTPEYQQMPPPRHQAPPPSEERKFGNPAPLGLCGFALTAFLSNGMSVFAGVPVAGENVSSALAYGGIIQVLVGMWELALGNTFGATSFCSYGAYWISFALLNFDGTKVTTQTANHVCQSEMLMGLFMMAWFIFTTIMLLCTLKSSLAMFLLFFFLDMNYLLLGIANIQCGATGEIMATVQKAGGIFGLLAAFAAWYNAFAGIFDKSNGFFTVPLGHFPWSPLIHAHQSKFKEV